MTERLIGVDAGGTVIKAALFDGHGQELGCERRPNDLSYPAPGHTERDADQMWVAACSAIRGLLESTGTSPSQVSGISITGYGCGLYVVGRDGKPLRPGIGSTDTRAATIIRRWEREGLSQRAVENVQQRFWPGQSVALMAWLAEHEPEIVERAHCALFCKDFLRNRLCGDMATDPTDAGISGLMNLLSRDYDRLFLAELGLKPWLNKLPAIRDSAVVGGTVSADAAHLTGLQAGTPVIRGVVDVAASSLASGVTHPGQLNVVAGTFSINQTLHTAPRLSHPPFLQCPYPLGNYYLATEGGATSASNLDWFCRAILPAEAVLARQHSESIYDLCNRRNAQASNTPNNILFLPFLFGGPDGAPAGLLGMNASHGLNDIMRAIYEGIVFAHKHDIDLLLSGPDAACPHQIRLAGGASRSDIWAQMFADILAMPVEVTRGTEFGALGAAITSAVALGIHADFDTAVAAMARPERHFEPNSAKAGYYNSKYTAYCDVVEALGKTWSGTPAAIEGCPGPQ